MTSTDRIQPSVRALRWVLYLQVAAMVLVAVWFRCRALSNLPGLNGDEAWYGARVMEFLHGGEFPWRTPTGNLANPFFLLPFAALHTVFAPSILVLRSVAAVSGLAALMVNWGLCRWVFDRKTALISTVALAVLPITIAYSRFAWDACQTLAATLPVFYLSLAAVRFPARTRLCLGLAILAEGAALLVHPTNVFATAAILAAMTARLSPEDFKRIAVRCVSDRRILAALVVGAVIVAISAWRWSGTAGPATAAERFVGAKDLAENRGLFYAVILYPRLFLGATIYEYIAGSESWLQWPSPRAATRMGVDTVLFWIALAAAAGMLWRSWRGEGRWEDRTLLSACCLAVAVFLLVAGPAAMTPHYERYAMVLVGPTILFLSRGAALAHDRAGARGRAVLVAGSLAGWLLLADFDRHYFQVMTTTGGESHRSLRTAAVEPKQAAFVAILAQRGEGPAWIVCSDVWLYWPMCYLASGEKDVHVVRVTEKSPPTAELEEARRAGWLWRVEFTGSKGEQQARQSFGAGGWRYVPLDEIPIADAAGRPLITVLHAGPEKAAGKPE